MVMDTIEMMRGQSPLASLLYHQLRKVERHDSAEATPSFEDVLMRSGVIEQLEMLITEGRKLVLALDAANTEDVLRMLSDSVHTNEVSRLLFNQWLAEASAAKGTRTAECNQGHTTQLPSTAGARDLASASESRTLANLITAGSTLLHKVDEDKFGKILKTIRSTAHVHLAAALHQTLLEAGVAVDVHALQTALLHLSHLDVREPIHDAQATGLPAHGLSSTGRQCLQVRKFGEMIAQTSGGVEDGRHTSAGKTELEKDGMERSSEVEKDGVETNVKLEKNAMERAIMAAVAAATGLSALQAPERSCTLVGSRMRGVNPEGQGRYVDERPRLNAVGSPSESDSPSESQRRSDNETQEEKTQMNFENVSVPATSERWMIDAYSKIDAYSNIQLLSTPRVVWGSMGEVELSAISHAPSDVSTRHTGTVANRPETASGSRRRPGRIHRRTHEHTESKQMLPAKVLDAEFLLQNQLGDISLVRRPPRIAVHERRLQVHLALAS